VNVVSAILGLIIGGALIGALARLAVPGPDPMPIWLTIVIGAVGANVGGAIGFALLGAYGVFFGALTVAILLVIAYRRFVQHRPITGPAARLPPKRDDDAMAQLERLAALRDRGAITPEEFEAKKAELLGRI
jgi:uncharacterized membrane protein YeaQ/YmgE (transglycosylase-associated protein family)